MYWRHAVLHWLLALEPEMVDTALLWRRCVGRGPRQALQPAHGGEAWRGEALIQRGWREKMMHAWTREYSRCCALSPYLPPDFCVQYPSIPLPAYLVRPPARDNE